MGHSSTADWTTIGSDTPAVSSITVALNLTICAIIIAFWNKHLLKFFSSLFLGILPLSHTSGNIFAVAPIGNFQLRIFAFCSLKFTPGQKSSSIRCTKRFLRRTCTVQTAFSVFVLIHPQKRERGELLGRHGGEQLGQQQQQRHPHPGAAAGGCSGKRRRGTLPGMSLPPTPALRLGGPRSGPFLAFSPHPSKLGAGRAAGGFPPLSASAGQGAASRRCSCLLLPRGSAPPGRPFSPPAASTQRRGKRR